MKIINLPSEIMFNIFSYCFNINLALVHPIWNRLIKDEDFITDYCMSLTNYDKPNIIFFSYHCNIEKILCNIGGVSYKNVNKNVWDGHG